MKILCIASCANLDVMGRDADNHESLEKVLNATMTAARRLALIRGYPSDFEQVPGLVLEMEDVEALAKRAKSAHAILVADWAVTPDRVPAIFKRLGERAQDALLGKWAGVLLIGEPSRYQLVDFEPEILAAINNAGLLALPYGVACVRHGDARAPRELGKRLSTALSTYAEWKGIDEWQLEAAS